MKKLRLWHLLSVPQQMFASPFLGLNRNNTKQTWKNNTGQLLLMRLGLLSVQDSFCEGMGTIVRSPKPTHRNVSHIYDPITERGRDPSRGIIGNAGHQPTWKKKCELHLQWEFLLNGVRHGEIEEKRQQTSFCDLSTNVQRYPPIYLDIHKFIHTCTTQKYIHRHTIINPLLSSWRKYSEMPLLLPYSQNFCQVPDQNVLC